MADPCDRRNPLQRAGLTQPGRHIPERRRDHFLPDERDLADMILFGQRFARQLKFYAPNNTDTDPATNAPLDWSAFFESDVTAALAGLAKLPIEGSRQFQGDLENWLRSNPVAGQAQAAKVLGDHFRLWFHLPVALLETVSRHHARLPADHLLAAGLPRLVARDLAEPLSALMGWYRGALLNPPNLFTDAALLAVDFNLTGASAGLLRLPGTIAEAVLNRPELSKAPVSASLLAQIPGAGDWAQFFGGAQADRRPFEEATGAFDRIYDALTYNLLTRSAERVGQAYQRLRQDAEAALAASLEGFAAHPAHYSLWLAFLKLFRHAQDQLNGFTGRHMDFYLREVLQLHPRAAIPDQAHLTFGLAKGVARHFLPAGTPFRGGKDPAGRPVSFALDADIVVNRATVSRLTGLYLHHDVEKSGETLAPRSSVAVNSVDGLGLEPLPPESRPSPLLGRRGRLSPAWGLPWATGACSCAKALAPSRSRPSCRTRRRRIARDRSSVSALPGPRAGSKPVMS